MLRGRRNAPMTGHIEVDGRDYGTLSATHQDTWTTEVAQRIRALGMPADALNVKNHVEMKAVVATVRSGARNARVIINHAPCGSEPRAPIGCEQYLPVFIPKGCSVTVLGTDAQGNLFQQTYLGRAPA
ncbi:hypothetical protein [Alloactinosynnema sp. L-07]|uniref:DddA-like double-stranded DNA deaminase toxin n=1 Tax=Alloactinosynnema sp. L-07 TaxID=1653480 RepID=UPI00065EF2ED|nr:DddA-like double-stranded DNA deaminase toxin [Alloactinosynnema sp. L-07]CRK61500.1 hypothetical protein [Alloactinosynnema sp. L-07]